MKSFKQLKKLNLVKGLSLKEETYAHLCKGYVEGKCHKQKFPEEGGEQTFSLIEIVHSNLCSLMQIKSLGGASYKITFIGQFSRKLVINFLEQRNQVLNCFKEYKVFTIKNRHENALKH
jgi:hypothetical protein